MSTDARKWVSLEKAKGIQYREHQERKIRPRTPDRYWRLYYKFAGKIHSEAIGWESEGWSEAEIIKLSGTLAANRKQGIAPGTFSELRAANTSRLEEAQEQAQEAQQKADQQKAFLKTFAEVFPMYLVERKGEVENFNTYRDESSKGYKWLVPCFGETPISEITPEHILAFIKECLKPTKKIKEHGKKIAAIPKPRSGGTVKHYINLLSQVWDWSKKQGYCTGENPARNADVNKAIPKSGGKRFRFLTKDEAAQLLPALKRRSIQLWAKCVTILYCGLRPIEVHSLTWEDIDEENKQIRVLREVKTNKGETRIIPYPNAFSLMLDEIRPESALSSDLVFPPKSIRKERQEGIAAKSWEISDVFNDVIEEFGWNNGKAQNDKVVPYSLRHTYASWLVQAGVPLYTVAELLGHSTTEVTKRYAHLAPDNLKAAISIFNE